VAPALTRGRATRFARDAFRRAYRAGADAVTCSEPVNGVASCTGSLDGAAAVVEVRYSVRSGRLYWTYSARAGDSAAARRGRVGLDLGRTKRVPLEREGAFPPKAAARAARVGFCRISGRA
jgi:hypothetical protein